MKEVRIGRAPLDRLTDLLTASRARAFWTTLGRSAPMLEGRTVWNLSSTAQGGGVAEMLQTLLAYGRAADVDTRWLVIDGDETFFRITKRVHNLLHGQSGDGGPLGAAEREHFTAVQENNAANAVTLMRPGDVVLLHDPQTAGLTESLQRAGAHVVWRCHVGRDTANEQTERAWSFLRPFVADADAFVFSRKEYPPAWVPTERLWVIAPSLDPFSTKNAEMGAADVAASLRRAGLVDAAADHGSHSFIRRDGTRGGVRAHRGLLDGDGLPSDSRLVMQVSRWDRLKDMPGVMRGFVDAEPLLDDDVHLMLVGPDVSGVTDDPEGAEVLDECRLLRRQLPTRSQERVHLCCLPMDDVDENAHLVNCLQRYAEVVVQKSLVEGFGLTVTEPMWKARPVVASAVGGIRDQIVDGASGVLLDDPSDLDAFGKVVARVLSDQSRARDLGAAARERVRDRFLPDRHLTQYAALFDHLVNG